jgi:hypothetical protein
MLPVVFLAATAASLAAAAAPTEQAAKDGVYLPTATTQSETDEYTRYELLGPETAGFRIYYEVTATTPGAKFFYNPIRKGSWDDRPEAVDVLLKARRRVGAS